MGERERGRGREREKGREGEREGEREKEEERDREGERERKGEKERERGRERKRKREIDREGGRQRDLPVEAVAQPLPDGGEVGGEGHNQTIVHHVLHRKHGHLIHLRHHVYPTQDPVSLPLAVCPPTLTQTLVNWSVGLGVPVCACVCAHVYMLYLSASHDKTSALTARGLHGFCQDIPGLNSLYVNSHIWSARSTKCT